MDPILSSITLIQLRLIEDQLTNNEVSPDEELHSCFVANGLTPAQAAQALTYRDRYRQNMYLDGHTPILKGHDALSFDRAARCAKACGGEINHAAR